MDSLRELGMVPLCPHCDQPAVPTTWVMHYRRGGRVLPVETNQWRCPGGCLNEQGDGPHVFADLKTMHGNEALAEAAWLQHFGVPMPRHPRFGRGVGEPRDQRLDVRLAASEMAHVDRVRGEMSRSEFVRWALAGAVWAKRPGPEE